MIMAEEKKKRRALADLPADEREMAAMRKARTAIASLDTPEARIRVVNWLSAVCHSELPKAPPRPAAASQLTLDDLGE